MLRRRCWACSLPVDGNLLHLGGLGLRSPEFGVGVSGFGVQGREFRVWGSGFGGSGLGVQGFLGFRIWGLGVRGFRFRV